MITAKLKRIVPLQPNAQLDTKIEGEATSFDIIEFEPGPNKRYAISVPIGDLPPKEASTYLHKMHKHLNGFFPDGTLLLLPTRDGQPQSDIYEIEIQ